ncbi:MAG: hypothetical protein R6W31_08665 [Bacteroidales bacterium]
MLFLSVLFVTVFHTSNIEEPGSRIVWHWEDEFNAGEQLKVKEWLTRVTLAAEATIGVYPFDLHFHIHRRNSSPEPVPWASTRRHPLQGVDFHIDPSYPLKSFMDDWTAPHEISHLSIPFLGSEYAWFAEGYASYMQYQIMQTLGICSPDEVTAIYAQKIERVKPSYDREEDFVTVAGELKSRNRYADMYWGGASYFMQIDNQLNNEYGQEITGFIKEYMQCCRLEDEPFAELIESWDHLLGDPIFSDLLHIYQTAPASGILK